MPQDHTHRDLVNKLIGHLNEQLAAGHDVDFVASAAVAAAASFTMFNLSNAYTRQVPQDEVVEAAVQFSRRCHGAAQEHLHG